MHEDAPALPGLLVETDWLREWLGHPGVRVIDVRDRADWIEGHIPGSAQLTLSLLGSSRDGCDNVLLPPAEFAHRMAEIGVSNGDTVVAYDDQWGLAAARVVWALHYYGHTAAAVLNGGWDRWRDEAGPTATGTSPSSRGRFEVRLNPEVYADLDRVATVVRSGGGVLIDTRTPGEFDSGHIPGAKMWDWVNAVPADSWDSVRNPSDLSSEWAELGVRPSDEVIVYCRSGMRAAHTYIALKHVGFPHVRLYDGSWQEWSEKAEDLDGR